MVLVFATTLGGFGLSSWPLGLELAAERPDRLCVLMIRTQCPRSLYCGGVAASRFFPALLAGVTSYRLGSDPNRGREF